MVHPNNGVLKIIITIIKIIVQCWKLISYQAMKRHGENLIAYYYAKEANLKSTYCMTPPIWHSGKGKTVEIQKRNQWLPGVGEGWRDEQVEHRGFSGQWEHSVRYHNKGYMSLCMSFYIYSNSQNVQFQGWILMPTMEFGWLWWVNIGSFIVTNVPLDVDDEAGYAYRKYMGNLCTLPSTLLWLPWWLSSKESACQCEKCRFWSLGLEDPLEEEMATHSRFLAWDIPWTEELWATVHGVGKNWT